MPSEEACENLKTIMLNRQFYEKVTHIFDRRYVKGIDGELEVMNYMKALELFTKYGCEKYSQLAYSKPNNSNQ